jgi:hypothetical protein
VPPGARIWAVDVEAVDNFEIDVRPEMEREFCYYVAELAEKEYPGYKWRVRRPL